MTSWSMRNCTRFSQATLYASISSSSRARERISCFCCADASYSSRCSSVKASTRARSSDSFCSLSDRSRPKSCTKSTSLDLKLLSSTSSFSVSFRSSEARARSLLRCSAAAPSPRVQSTESSTSLSSSFGASDVTDVTRLLPAEGLIVARTASSTALWASASIAMSASIRRVRAAPEEARAGIRFSNALSRAAAVALHPS